MPFTLDYADVLTAFGQEVGECDSVNAAALRMHACAVRACAHKSTCITYYHGLSILCHRQNWFAAAIFFFTAREVRDHAKADYSVQTLCALCGVDIKKSSCAAGSWVHRVLAPAYEDAQGRLLLPHDSSWMIHSAS